MAKDAGDRFEEAVDGVGGDGHQVKDTLFGSLVRSAASAVVSVTVTYAVGWLLKKLVDREKASNSP